MFHITAIANLAAICQAGALLAKNAGAAAGINYQNIAHQGAQGARAGRQVPNPPGGGVHDYVPFYFAPRSPMLMAINGGRVAGCNWRQDDIVHLETTVEQVSALGIPFVFYDRNATLAYAQPYTDLQHLDTAVAWDWILAQPQMDGYCKYWHDAPQYPGRMERRQAEFLLKDRVPLAVFRRIGAYNAAKVAQVRQILTAAGVNLPTEAKPDWYF
ncbi:MAG: type II toxin-antitoxin system toxin DNA ADP-ribosyl transferase DarT [Pseudomonadota bacterium]